MLSEVGWLVVIWIVWIAVFAITMSLIRLAMHGQQEMSANQEAHIIAAQTGQNEAEVRAAMASAVSEEPYTAASPEVNWRLRMPRRPAPPPVGA
ncbi:MAG: hypothetical protein KGO05_02385 [Chloroflexota bacterium]|nr:hypothetical protein [Chloroflexota bacterium]